MKFNTVIAKLTFFCTLIIMVISVGFSLTIYQLSAKEINRGLGRQNSMLQNLPQRYENQIMTDFNDLQESQISESSSRLKKNLQYYNLLILILSAIGSYFFARWTLRPLQEAMDEQNRFTADASHELRTPLAAMQSEIEVSLRDEKFNLADAKKLLYSNLEEVGKLETLSGALLKLAKFDEVNKLEFLSLNLDEVIVESYEKVEKLAKNKKIEIEAKLIKSKVFGDKVSLTELFVILFENAIKYSPEKSKILVRMSNDKNHPAVSVKDHGVGIKLSDLPHIFDRFYRADQSRNKEKTDGYGLGLSIAKRIADLHSAKISVTSIAGKGSEFTITF